MNFGWIRPLRCGALAAAAATLAAGCGAGRSSSPGGAGPFPAAENAKPGTTGWRIRGLGPPGSIAGYASTVSVLPGQRFTLFVSTTASSFRVRAFRMGWYGGAEAREVWQSGRLAGLVQAPPRLNATTRTVQTAWRPSLSVSTAGWPQGSYLLRLDAPSGPQSYVPITVRSPDTAGKVVILEGVTTWQAYNQWGGYDLYDGPHGYADRSYAVSFDRPFTQSGADLYLAFDQPPIALAERAGVPLAYETDVDLDETPRLLARARAVISLGHDEYYSAAMRNDIIAARSAGTNLAFLGANAMYRHIRFESSPLGRDRLEIAYKVARSDPRYGHDNAATTQDWRDRPDPRPESAITGVLYECEPVSSSFIVHDSSSWIFSGTGARDGTAFAGLVGPEYDRINPAAPVPRPLEVLAQSPVRCHGKPSVANAAYYTARNGAGVFSSGTMRWVCAMRGVSCGHGVSAAAQRFVDRTTENLLRAFAAGPAGRSHPAIDNLAQLRPRKGLIDWPGQR